MEGWVRQMHIDWRPDLYRYSETVLPPEIYEQAAAEKPLFIAEYGGRAAGILLIVYRHIESANQVTRDIIFVDSMAVDESCRGMGIGHAFLGKAVRQCIIRNWRHLSAWQMPEVLTRRQNRHILHLRRF